MDKLPELERLSELEKDAPIAALWAKAQCLKAQFAALVAKPHEPRKDAHNSSLAPSQTPKANLPPSPRTSPCREASMGHAGGGRPLTPHPDQVVLAQAKVCPHRGGAAQAPEQQPPVVYDKIELLPAKLMVTQVEQHARQCLHRGQTYVAPASVGIEPGTPCGASIGGLTTHLRS